MTKSRRRGREPQRARRDVVPDRGLHMGLHGRDVLALQSLRPVESTVRRISPALELAIVLRQQVRNALDRDDMPEVRRLNRLADEAYQALGPFEAIAFLDWARGRVVMCSNPDCPIDCPDDHAVVYEPEGFKCGTFGPKGEP